MKWTYSIKNKLVASAALLSLCLLVLFSHYIDRNHTENVKNSIGSLYEDRLIAEEYILKMTNSIYQIKGELNKDSSKISTNNSIQSLLLTVKETNNAYHETKFIELEKVKAAELRAIILEIESTSVHKPQELTISADKAIAILNELSAIQIAESKQIMAYSEKLYLSGKTSSQFVFALIIIILIVLQAIVFTSKPLIPKDKSNFPNLN